MVQPGLENSALEAFREGDALGFVHCAFGQNALDLVVANILALRKRGIYEEALLTAFTTPRINNSDWPERYITLLFRNANQDKLRAAGDQIPTRPLVVYRGISGHGHRRRKRGWSWTDSLNAACWFALRMGLPNPAVLKATVNTEEILAFLDREREFIVRPKSFMPLRMSMAQMAEHSSQFQADQEKKRSNVWTPFAVNTRDIRHDLACPEGPPNLASFTPAHRLGKSAVNS
jgi:hypothetical protein